MSGSSSGPTLSLPSSEQVVADGTLAVTGASYSDSFAAGNPGAMYLEISDTAGTLTGFYPGSSGEIAAGNGSNRIAIQGSYADIQDIISSLTYTAAGTSGSDSINFDIWNQAGVETTGSIPVTISSGATGGTPVLREPSSETVAAGATLAVSGSYSDSFAAGNPGAMFLSISDSSGTLTSQYPGDNGTQTVSGNGSSPLIFQGSYADVQAILDHLLYVNPTAGSDTIHFDIWDQAGVETTGSVPVTVTAAGSGGTDTWTGAENGDWNNAANWSAGAVPVSGDTVIIPADTANNAGLSDAVLSGETITLDDSNGVPVVSFTNVTLGNGSRLDGNAGQIEVGGTLTIGTSATFAPTGNVHIYGATTSPSTLVNDGLITGGGAGDITGLGDIVINDGTILGNGGHIGVGSTLINNGSVWLSNAATLEVDGTIVGGTIDLSGGGHLQLAASMATDSATIVGFSQGDVIADYQPIDSLTYNDNTLDMISAGTVVQAIQFGGGLGLGNFQLVHSNVQPYSGDSSVEFVAPGQAGTVDFGQDVPDIAAPAVGTINGGGTLSLSTVAISNATTVTLDITAQSGTLYMDGASGSGTNHLTIAAGTPESQVDADLATLRYVAPTTSQPLLDTVEVTAQAVTNPSQMIASRYIPISVAAGGGGGSTGPTLTEPAAENVASGGTVAVAGSYSDAFAQSNPGQLYLDISDSSGTLRATDASGNTASGSGTNHISLSTDFVDLNAILSSLHYQAGAATGSDNVSFDIWNQAGQETTGTTAITIGNSPQGSSMTMADFTVPTTTSGGVTSGSASTTSGSGTVSDTQPMAMPVMHLPT